MQTTFISTATIFWKIYFRVLESRGETRNWRDLFSNITQSANNRGIASLLKIVILGSVYYFYYKQLRSQNTFVFQDSEYNYFYSFRNVTWLSERCIEIPIVKRIMDKHKGKRILEIGNVLSNYFVVRHEVVDKYEFAKGVINQDVVDFRPNHLYELIVSISTLEHVGWDENPRDNNKIPRAIENLRSLLTPDGTIVVTLPIGYNTVMDRLIQEGKVQFNEIYYLKRISRGNMWEQAKSFDDAQGSGFVHPLSAKAIMVGIINR